MGPGFGKSGGCKRTKPAKSDALRKRRSRQQIAELVHECTASGLTQRKFGEDRGIALSELQRSLKIVRRASEPKLMAVQIEAGERRNDALELIVGDTYT
jgi:hypothetical protein